MTFIRVFPTKAVIIMPRKVTQHIVPRPENQDTEYKNPHSAAVARYNAKNYNTFSVNLKHEEYEKLMLIAARCGAGKSRILIELLNRLPEDEIIKLLEQDKEIMEEAKPEDA